MIDLDNASVYEDAFNLLCGDLIGSGAHRKVFECRLDKSLVVKVEMPEKWRYFANVHEMKFWNDHQYYKKVSDWLAPCEYLSPDGRILLQKKVSVANENDKLPECLPAFLTDVKAKNFGWYEGRFVCVDYAITLINPSTRLKKVTW